MRSHQVRCPSCGHSITNAVRWAYLLAPRDCLPPMAPGNSVVRYEVLTRPVRVACLRCGGIAVITRDYPIAEA